MRNNVIVRQALRWLWLFGQQLIWLIGPIFVPALRSRRYFLAGHRFSEVGDPARAAAAYAIGLKYKPSAFDIWINYGHVLQSAGNTSEAAAAFKYALELRPDDVNLHGQIAQFARAVGNTSEAVRHELRAEELKIEMAMAIEPKFTQAVSPEALKILLRLLPEGSRNELRTFHAQSAALLPLLLRASQLARDAACV